MNAYISGGICGNLWMGGLAGKPIKANLRPLFDRFSDPASFRDVLLSFLMHEGGDFQNPEFTEDTEMVFSTQKILGPYKWETRVKVREIANIPELSDLVKKDVYVSDFFGEE